MKYRDFGVKGQKLKVRCGRSSPRDAWKPLAPADLVATAPRRSARDAVRSGTLATQPGTVAGVPNVWGEAKPLQPNKNQQIKFGCPKTRKIVKISIYRGWIPVLTPYLVSIGLPATRERSILKESKAMTPNARFTEFITDVTPSATTNTRSASAHNSVRDALTADDTYKGDVIRTFLGGSYKRKTAVRPVTKNGDKERPDVDIYVVVKGSTSFFSSDHTTPDALIEALFSALNRNRTALGITKIKRNRCSIAISTEKADMDVSPLLERDDDGYYRIGNRETGEWYLTEPEEHTNWSAGVNADAGMRFNPMVKMNKWSRREFPTKHKHPKSIALEALVAKHMSRTDNTISSHGVARWLVTNRIWMCDFELQCRNLDQLWLK